MVDVLVGGGGLDGGGDYRWMDLYVVCLSLALYLKLCVDENTLIACVSMPMVERIGDIEI
jgi:hypothetical protein